LAETFSSVSVVSMDFVIIGYLVIVRDGLPL